MPHYMNNNYKQFRQYLETKNKSPLTLRDYDSYFKAFVSYTGDVAPEKITLRLVDDFEKTLSDKQPSTRSYYLIFIRNFLKFMTRKGLNVLNYQLIELPKVNRKILPALNEKEVEALIKSSPAKDFDGLRTKTIILLLLTSGARVAEIQSLKLTDLELEENRATIMGKGGKMRVIFFDDVTKHYLRKYLEVTTGAKLYDLSIRQIERIVKEAGVVSGISKPVTPHVLRRTFATRMLRKGVNIRVLQEFMGHTQITTTSRYISIEQDELAKVHQLAHKKATKNVEEKEMVIIGRESLQNLNGRINKVLEVQNKILKNSKKEEPLEIPPVKLVN